MIGEIERLLLNKLNNGERYFCSSELPKDESSLFELDSATRRELARLTGDGVIRKAETGAYEILLDIGAMRERIVRSSGKRKQKKQLKPEPSGFSDMQIAACRWQFRGKQMRKANRLRPPSAPLKGEQSRRTAP